MKKIILLLVALFFAILFLVFGPPLKKKDFEKLMGKGTKYWKYLSQEGELSTLQKYKEIFDKQVRRLEDASSEQRIPKIVHFIWVGPHPFPEKSIENVKMWILRHPDWKFKFWTDRKRDAPCQGMEVMQVKDFPFLQLGKYYDRTENYGEQSDLLRFEILFQEGGIYADHDANCLKKFDRLTSSFDFFCGLEVPHPPVNGHSLTAGIGVLGSAPGHPLIKNVIDLIDSRWEPLAEQFHGKDLQSTTNLTMYRTYLALTDVLKGGLGENDIILPAAYFFAKSKLKPVYSKHYFADSWREGKQHYKKGKRS